MTAEAVLELLMKGNRRYVTKHLTHQHQDAARIHEIATGQHPIATMLGCFDSRVPPEAIFDQGLGDLFVIRVAGNVVDAVVLGSIAYAVAEFGVSLVMVLGHERCGAVTATRLKTTWAVERENRAKASPVSTAILTMPTMTSSVTTRLAKSVLGYIKP